VCVCVRSVLSQERVSVCVLSVLSQERVSVCDMFCHRSV